MTTPPQPQSSPAARLAAVLRVIKPGVTFAVMSDGTVQERQLPPTIWVHPAIKDDLAYVVDMLTPKQRTAFGEHLFTHLDAPDYAEAITAPASVWLAALAAATGVE